ncbi:MAG: Stenotrophomonas phage vB SmaS 5 [Pseudomonadota bacterium]
MTIVVFLASAMLCIGNQCYPALVGKDTPIGQYPLIRRYVQAKGYGGDVMQFAETPEGIMAIHRVWLGRPKERRLQRLASNDPSQRRAVTNGCINVMPEVYEALVTADRVEVRD